MKTLDQKIREMQAERMRQIVADQKRTYGVRCDDILP